MSKENSTSHPRMTRGFVDKLAFTLPTQNVVGSQVEWFSRVETVMRNAIRAGICRHHFGGGNRYRRSLQLPLNANHYALIQYGSVDPTRQKAGFRIEFNPDKTGTLGANKIIGFLEDVFPGDVKKLLPGALINRIDIASDVTGLLLEDLVVRYENAQTVAVVMTRYRQRGRIESYSFGSVRSSAMGVVYDKSTHRIKLALREIAAQGFQEEALNSNRIRTLTSLVGGPPTVRFEHRGKGLRLKPSELGTMENRFLRFQMCHLSDVRGLSERRRAAFISMCRDVGVVRALEAFEGSPDHFKLKKLTGGRPGWWKPHTAWAQAISSLDELQLFSKPTLG